MKKVWKNTLFWAMVVPFLLIYVTLAYFTYGMINSSAEKLSVMEQEITEAEETGEVLSFQERNEYRRTYDLYYKSQRLIQSFWMRYIFDFPEFREPL
ncbi:hypothetical protein [Alteribacter populi]|uniref:hypothetical protein n=1 Tax=Alteribacter populi TaxID=2011011 RepID=UPI000BBB06E9|nr:hypothetical protein [Alteribacter populi]